MTATTCPECGGEVVPQGNEEVCVVCGLVRERLVCDEKYVSFTSVDHHALLISSSDNPLRSKGNRVRKTHRDIRDDTLYHMIKSVNAPEHIRNEAVRLTSMYLRSGNVRKIGSYDEFVDAALFLSYRIWGEVPDMDVLGNIPEVRKKAGKLQERLREAGARLRDVSLYPRPHEWVQYIAGKLGRQDIIDDALKILPSITGCHSSPTRAGVSVIRALELRGDSPCFTKVAAICGLSSSTLSKAYKATFKCDDRAAQIQTPARGVAQSEWLTLISLTLKNLSSR